MHHVERTGLALYPPLVQHLSAHQAESPDPVIEDSPSEPLPSEPHALARLETPVLPPPALTDAQPAAEPSAPGPVVTINSLISTTAAPVSSDPEPNREVYRTVDTLAVDAELDELQRQAASGMDVVAGMAASSPSQHDPVRQRLVRTIQEIRRTGCCDHPALEARIDALHEVPALVHGDLSGALRATLAANRQLLLCLQDQLLPSGLEPVLGSAFLPGVASQLRSCRRSLGDLRSSFGAELQAPLQAMMHRQLSRARRLDWRLRWELLRNSDHRILAPLITALVQILLNVVALWTAADSGSFASEETSQMLN